MAKMSIWYIFLILQGIQRTISVSHSMKYFYTASSQVPNFPEFVIVGLVDEVQIYYYDSNTQRAEPKQDWVRNNTDQQYWEQQSEIAQGQQQVFKNNIEVVKQLFNQTGGVHIMQYMYGCEWDNETQQVTGYRRYGYDGEDWLVWNMESNTWSSPKQQGLIITNKWNNDTADLEYFKNYLNQICPGWVKNYIDYGRSSLMRTDLPSVSFLQKPSSSLVSCLATGFYPNRAQMFWRKDGEEIHEGVDKGEILPNNDGTFQMSADLKLSSENPEEWAKYECVFQLSGVKDDVVTRLEKTKIRIRTGQSQKFLQRSLTGAVIGGVMGLVILIGIIVGVLMRRRRNHELQRTNTSDDSVFFLRRS